MTYKLRPATFSRIVKVLVKAHRLAIRNRDVELEREIKRLAVQFDALIHQYKVEKHNSKFTVKVKAGFLNWFAQRFPLLYFWIFE